MPQLTSRQKLDQALAARRRATATHDDGRTFTRKKLRPIHLCMDFDGTLTKRDTINALAGVCYKEHARRGNYSFPPWSHFVDAYMKDYQEHEDHYRPKKEDRRTLDEELKWLHSLERVDKASFERIKDSGLFDLKLEDMGYGDDGTPILYEPLRTGEIQMRKGYVDIVADTFNMNPEDDDLSTWVTRAEVVSVNWSRTWIEYILVAAAYDDCSPGDYTPVIFAYISYWAGEATHDRTVTGPNFDHDGKIPLCFSGSDEQLYTSHDKFRAFTSPADCFKNGDPTGPQGIRIYVGDSTTDLECLLGAHLGICMQDEEPRSGQQELAETLHRVGIQTKRLPAFDERDLMLLKDRLSRRPWPPVERFADGTFKLSLDVDTPRILYTARDFTEITWWRRNWHWQIPFNDILP